ncbi:16424_t:CDS:1, partial [Dentiscutata heterogama]
HWQYAHKQLYQNIAIHSRANCSQGQNRKTQTQSNNTEAEDMYKVEYLLLVTTTGLIKKVRVAIYLSIDKL